MKEKTLMRPLASCLLGLIWVTTGNAEEARQLEAHEHGVGQLNIAIEGTSVAMEFEAPGADIVGFEYEATSIEDRALIDQALTSLASPLELFVMPTEAQCTTTEVNVALNDDDHDSHDKHDDHVNEAHHDDHDDHSDEHVDEKATAEASHTEFHAEYVFTCSTPEAITAIEFAYFELFPNAQELVVQVITDQGASAYEIPRDNPTLNLSSLM